MQLSVQSIKINVTHTLAYHKIKSDLQNSVKLMKHNEIHGSYVQRFPILSAGGCYSLVLNFPFYTISHINGTILCLKGTGRLSG